MVQDIEQESQGSTPNFSLNNAPPADSNRDLQVAAVENLLRLENLLELIRRSTPDDISESVRAVVEFDAMSTDSKLGLESRASFQKVLDKKTTPEYETIRSNYGKGLATGSEVLKLMVELKLDTVTLLQRDHPYENPPQDFQDELARLIQTATNLQTPSDLMGIGGDRTKIKQIDVHVGQGKLGGMMLSRKTNLMTVDSGQFVIGLRKKILVDVNAMPVKWRSRLRQTVASTKPIVQDDELNDGVTVHGQTPEQLAFLEAMPMPNPYFEGPIEPGHVLTAEEIAQGYIILDDTTLLIPNPDHQQTDLKPLVSLAPREEQRLKEVDMLNELYNKLLSMPNPENPDESLELASASTTAPYLHQQQTIVYAFRLSPEYLETVEKSALKSPHYLSLLEMLKVINENDTLESDT